MATQGPAQTMPGAEPAQTMPGAEPTQGAAPSGTVTFLFTDIEGSTRLLERLRGRYAEVLAEQRRILRGAFGKWHGHEIDTQGDSFFVAFPRAADALRCAIDAQRALAGWRWPGEADVRVRMGIHTGEPLIGTIGYVGMSVHRAARIAGAGHGAQILLSSTTSDLVADDLPAGIELKDLGAHRLKDLRVETHLYQVTGEGLRDDFEPLSTGRADEPPPTPGDAPYRGLQAFEEQDADLFFGRDEIVAELSGRLRTARFVALIGASGSGKSSILRAGLIPALRADTKARRVLLLTPTAHPLEELAGAMAPDASAARIAALVDDLRADPRSLALGLRQKTGQASSSPGRTRSDRVVIAVDQLEEIFTLCRDEDERQAFLSALAHASGVDEGPADTPADADRATVVITLRADFYASLAPYPLIRAAAAASQMYVGAMSPNELRRAIEEPARRGGWEFTPGLVDLLLRDVGDEPGALPLLSHALLETWQRRRGVTLTLRSYAESGGVKGAIARTADRVYRTELSESQQRIARDIFVRLTELGEGAQDTRRRARIDELMPDDPARAKEVGAVISALAGARLVTVGEETVEVAHEALIREWPTLRDWLSADRESLRVHRRLGEAAAEWQLSGMDDSLLFRRARLAQARESTAYQGVLNVLERRFLDASVAHAEQEQVEHAAAQQREVDAAQALAAAESRRAEEAARSASGLRKRALLLGLALVVAAGLAGLAFVLAQDSNANAALAEKRALEARDNAAIAQERASEASDNAALAQQREQEARDAEAEARNAEAVAQEQATRALAQRLGADATQVLLSDREPELAALLALNSLHAGYNAQADAALQRAGRQQSSQLFSHATSVESLVVTPDGKTMITVAGGNVLVWDVDSGTTTQRFAAPRGSANYGSYSYVELSSDGGTLLASGYSGPGAIYSLSGRPTMANPVAFECPSLIAETGIRALSGNGQVLATYLTGPGEGGNPGDVLIVSIPDCIPLAEPFQLVGLNDPALNEDGTLLAASLLDNSVMTLWDVTAGQERVTFGADVGQFWHSSFSRDGTKLVTGNFDGTAHVFDVGTGDLLQTYRGHSGGVEHAVLSDDGSRLLTSSFDNTARLWDTSTTSEVRRFVHGDAVRQAALTADADEVFTASEDGTARRWLAGATGEEFTFIATDGEVSGLAFSSDGQSLASVGGDVLRVFDLTGQSLTVDARRAASRLVAYSPSGESLLAVSSFGTSLLDAHTGEEIRRLSESDVAGSGFAASFSADGRLVLGTLPGTFSELLLFDTETGEHRGIFQLVAGVLSADGSKVAGWSPGRYTVYDATTGDALKNMGTMGTANSDERAVDVAFTPDGQRLVIGDHDNVVRVRDVATGEVLLQMPGHASPIRQVRVSADGAYALTASDDGTARLWSLETGALARVFPGHGGRAVTAIAISPDGHTVALGSGDGSVIVTFVSLDELETDVCARMTRDLTPQERIAYGVQGSAPTCP